MTPLTQTVLYDATQPSQQGNCWQTVLASVLDLPLDEVPHFVQDDEDHNGRENFEWDWWKRSIDWLRERGFQIEYAEIATTPDEYLIASGKSPRGNGTVYHVVIYRDGVMVHDPHPDRTGLLTVDAYAYTIRPITAQPSIRNDDTEATTMTSEAELKRRMLRQTKADVWDEGFFRGYMFRHTNPCIEGYGPDARPGLSENPYREDADHDQ